MVDRAVRVLRDAGCAEAIVVAGAVELTVGGAQVVMNPLWEGGMGSSLRTGLAAAAQTDADMAVILLVDTPWVRPEALVRVASHVEADGAAIATYNGRRGHPVGLHRTVWAEVAELAVDDMAARAWLRARPDHVIEVDCTGLGDPRDVDRPEDLGAAPDR